MVRTCCYVAVFAACSAQAFAYPATAVWPTYYRTGPDKAYAVLDEVFRGQSFEVLSCDNGWCRVQAGRSIGYMEQAALAPADATAPAATQPHDCFEAQSAGFHKGEYYRYCAQTK